MVIVVMIMKLMHAHNVYYRMMSGVKMLLLLVWTIVHQHHPDNRKKDIIILGEGPTGGLDNTTITTDAKYFVNITMSRKKIYLNLHCNAVFLFVNGVKRL